MTWFLGIYVVLGWIVRCVTCAARWTETARLLLAHLGGLLCGVVTATSIGPAAGLDMFVMTIGARETATLAMLAAVVGASAGGRLSRLLMGSDLRAMLRVDLVIATWVVVLLSPAGGDVGALYALVLGVYGVVSTLCLRAETAGRVGNCLASCHRQIVSIAGSILGGASIFVAIHASGVDHETRRTWAYGMPASVVAVVLHQREIPDRIAHAGLAEIEKIEGTAGVRIDRVVTRQGGHTVTPVNLGDILRFGPGVVAVNSTRDIEMALGRQLANKDISALQSGRLLLFDDGGTGKTVRLGGREVGSESPRQTMQVQVESSPLRVDNMWSEYASGVILSSAAVEQGFALAEGFRVFPAGSAVLSARRRASLVKAGIPVSVLRERARPPDAIRGWQTSSKRPFMFAWLLVGTSVLMCVAVIRVTGTCEGARRAWLLAAATIVGGSIVLGMLLGAEQWRGALEVGWPGYRPVGGAILIVIATVVAGGRVVDRGWTGDAVVGGPEV